MAKRKHAEMISAWADNDELVVFVREGNADWRICALPIWDGFAEYFLCLPQHNENGQCLHWLNGGAVEFKVDGGTYSDFPSSITEWLGERDMWMDSDYQIRIKPKKEKRWIGYNKRSEVTTTTLYKTIADAESATVMRNEWQFIEIEVEI